MKRHILLAFWFFAVAVSLARAAELPWEFEYDKALEEAKTEQKPILLDFSASWCGPCRLMETTTFADAAVQAALGGFIILKVDLDANPELAAKYAVRAIPACILLNQFGEKVSFNVGYANPARFMGWLGQNTAAALAKESKGQLVIRRIKAIAANLEAADVAVRDRATADLLKVYCTREAEDDGSGAKLAENELRGMVQRHPALGVSYLNDRRLAVRILFAGFVSEKIGPNFQFDPWEPSKLRATAMEKLATQVEAH